MDNWPRIEVIGDIPCHYAEIIPPISRKFLRDHGTGTANVPDDCDDGVMNKNLTEIAFILDRSGSMSTVATHAINAFNAFLQDQQTTPGQGRLTLVLFDDECNVLLENVPVAEALPLTTVSYEPRGTTALLDAIGRTIDSMGGRLARTPEASRPGSVIIAIFTDGLENASRAYTWRVVSDLIKRQTREYSWEFLFLGANQDAIATAAQLNITAGNASAWTADGVGVRASTAAFSRKASALRTLATGIVSEELSATAAAPLSGVVEKEDRKRRTRGR